MYYRFATWTWCALVLLAQDVLAGPLDNPTVFPHNYSGIKYSNVAAGMGKAECNRTPNDCGSKWWVQNNEGNTAGSFGTTHTTSGPSASLSFKFYGSRALSVLGKRDSSVQPIVTLNGARLATSNSQEPELFRTENLNPDVAYTLEFRYTGGGFLSVAALLLDRDGTAGTPPPEPGPPASSPPSTSAQTTSDPSEPTSSPTDSNPNGDSPDQSTSGSPSATSSLSASITQPPTGGDGLPGDPTNSQNGPRSSTSSGQVEAATKPSPAEAPTGEPLDEEEREAARRSRNSAIAGAVVGGIVGLLLLLAAAWYLRKWMLARRAPSYAFRNRTSTWSPSGSNDRVPSDWEAFPEGASSGTSRQKLAAHESWVVGLPSPSLRPQMAESTDTHARPVSVTWI